MFHTHPSPCFCVERLALIKNVHARTETRAPFSLFVWHILVFFSVRKQQIEINTINSNCRTQFTHFTATGGGWWLREGRRGKKLRSTRRLPSFQLTVASVTFMKLSARQKLNGKSNRPFVFIIWAGFAGIFRVTCPGNMICFRRNLHTWCLFIWLSVRWSVL